MLISAVTETAHALGMCSAASSLFSHSLKPDTLCPGVCALASRIRSSPEAGRHLESHRIQPSPFAEEEREAQGLPKVTVTCGAKLDVYARPVPLKKVLSTVLNCLHTKLERVLQSEVFADVSVSDSDTVSHKRARALESDRHDWDQTQLES